MPPSTATTMLTTLGSIALLGCVACNDDSGDASDTTTTAATTASSGSGGAGGAGGSGGAGPGGGGEAPFEQNALIRGTLAEDPETAKAQHDQLASGSEEAAKSLGDFGHDAMLGTTLLGTTENEFLGFDRWDTDRMDEVYGDPDFQAAFGALFAAPPTLERFERNFEWHSWGDLVSGDRFDPHYFVVVRGRLADADLEDARATHDAIASGGEGQAIAAGDVAHVAFLGRDDPRELLAIDIWSSSENIEAFYGNPDFQEAFAALFEAPPTIGVYASTDWHQW